MWRWSLTDVGMADLVKDLDLPVNVGGMWGELGGVLESTGLVLTQVHPGSSSAVKERVRTRENAGELGRTRENMGEHGRNIVLFLPAYLTTELVEIRGRSLLKESRVQSSVTVRHFLVEQWRRKGGRRKEEGDLLREGR